MVVDGTGGSKKCERTVVVLLHATDPLKFSMGSCAWFSHQPTTTTINNRPTTNDHDIPISQRGSSYLPPGSGPFASKMAGKGLGCLTEAMGALRVASSRVRLRSMG